MLVVSHGAAGQRLEQTRPSLERRARCRQQQQRGRQLEEGEQAVADARLREVANLGAVRLRDPDLQAHCGGRQAERQRADNRERQPQRDAAEPPSPGVIELPQLSDRRGRRLNPGRECHRNRKRQ